MSRKKVKKAIHSIKKEISRPAKAKKVLSKIWWVVQLIAFLLLTILVSFLTSHAAKFFEAIVPSGNENWAVAMIALPIALFGVLLSILLPTMQKYSNRFNGQSLKALYKAGSHFCDFSAVFYYRIACDFLLWIISYFLLNYAGMIAYSLVLVCELLYLIIFTLWKYKQTPSELYLQNIMKNRFLLVENYDKEKKCYEKLLPLFEENKNLEILEIIEKEYQTLWEELNKLSLSIISSKDATEEREAFLSIIETIGKMELKETNALIIYTAFIKGNSLCEISIKQKDYAFAVSLANKLLEAWIEFLSNYIKFIGRYTSNIEILNDEYNFLLIREIDLVRKYNDYFSQRLNAYSQVLFLFNEQIDALIQKMKNEEMSAFISIEGYNRYLDLSRTACDSYQKLNEILLEKRKQRLIKDNSLETNNNS